MANTNKVEFGICNVYVGTYSVGTGGTVTLGTPVHIPGAVNFSPEDQGESNTFYADNVPYYTSFTSGVFEGDLEMAMFPDEFKTQFLGYVTLDDGGLAEIKNAVKPDIYLAFEWLGDKKHRRCIYYNGSLGSINHEYATVEDSVEVATETISTRFVGDNETGITRVTYSQGDTGYDTLFTNPPVPDLP